MKTVGLRELKNSLSKYVRHVRKGETIAITDRGEVVAELTPPGYSTTDSAIPPGMLELARKGLLTLPKRKNHPSVYKTHPRALPPGRALQLLDEERGDW
jgi:prevent-host-death family protein